VTVLRNEGVHTDRDVTANRPGAVIKNKRENLNILIDVAIPADRNAMQKEAEKKVKCMTLCVEIHRIWNMKCMFIPELIGAIGIETKGLNLEAALGKHSLDSIQRQMY
jgi:hypothetical protein